MQRNVSGQKLPLQFECQPPINLTYCIKPYYKGCTNFKIFYRYFKYQVLQLNRFTNTALIPIHSNIIPLLIPELVQPNLLHISPYLQFSQNDSSFSFNFILAKG